MAQKHKIGVHVSAQQRDNYGVAAPHLVSVTTFDPGAFDEIPDDAIKIFRTHAIAQHKDAPGDFDRLADKDLPGAAEWWWQAHLRKEYEPIRRKYGDNVYFQPINEINNPRTILYLRGMVKAAEKDGYKLALWGDAGGSPHLEDWIETWMPFMKEVQAGGHIYSRHAYSGVTIDSVHLTKEDGTPSDSNTGRPFVEAKLMLENGITMPMVITELGWRAGWNSLPSGWLKDLMRYNKLMMAHDNIVGCCIWNAGQWETAPNILAGKPLRDLGNQLKTMTPQFYRPGSIKLPPQAAGPLVDASQPIAVAAPEPPTNTRPSQPVAATTPPPPSTSTPGTAGAKKHLLVERFRDLNWYDWKLPNGNKSNMQVPKTLGVHNTTGKNKFSDGKAWNKFGLAEASYLTTGHNLSPDQKDLYTEYESLVTPGGFVVYKLFSTHAFNVTYTAKIKVEAGQHYRVETDFFADFAHYKNPKKGNHKKVTDRMDPRHGLVRIWADGHDEPFQKIKYMAKQNIGTDFVATQTEEISVHWQFLSAYAMAPGDGVAGYFITEISASKLVGVGLPVSATPTPTPVIANPLTNDSASKPITMLIKVGREETATAAARLMEHYAHDRLRSMIFSTDDMLTLLQAGSQHSIVEVYRPELPSNQDAIKKIMAAGYAWRELKLD
ncbi:MAG: hypothetical protein ACI85U_002761 [Candidatus Promineifilaceae bacterium]|jgi:hypothetical protein